MQLVYVNFNYSKHTIAMTGEITLRGLVLPVGGIKEKVLAAKRAGIKRVLLPAKNKKDVLEIDSSVLKGLTVSYVKRADQVLKAALSRSKANDPEEFFQVPVAQDGKKQPAESVQTLIETSTPTVN